MNEIIINETPADNFSDDEIKEMSYAIRNFDARTAGMKKSQQRWWFANQFNYRDRLNQIERDEEAAKPKVDVQMVECSCGHTVPSISVMSSSMGSSCPSCYDSMSY